MATHFLPRAKLDQVRINFELEANKINPNLRYGHGYGRGYGYGHQGGGYGHHMGGYGQETCWDKLTAGGR